VRTLKQNLEISFSSELPNVKQVVMNTLFFLQSAIPSLSCEEQTDLRLVFSELLYNAVVHGNKNDINKIVCLNVKIEDDLVIGQITDEGNGFDYTKVLERMNDVGLLEECGRGIRLVYSLTDKLTFNISGNAIHFYKRVAMHG
jgi:serine/threonine-protein kinase RsbW